MRLILAILGLIACTFSALAQQPAAPATETLNIDGTTYTVTKNPDGTYRRTASPNAILPAEKGVAYTVLENGDWYRYIINRYYDPKQRCWATLIDGGHASWGSCTPEYFIPPSALRTFRHAAKLEVEAPVYNPLTGKLEPLRPNEQ